MPTFYTANIESGADLTLRGYALRAARGMMALVTMHDAPNDAPIPRQLEPDTAYHDKALAAAEARLAELAAMTPEQITAALDAHNAGVREARVKAVADNDTLRQRYGGVLAEVEAWQGAPDGLKEFMLSLLGGSMRYEVTPDPLEHMPKETASAADWHAAECVKHLWAVNYHTEEIKAARARTAESNAWLAQLWASLPEDNA